MVHHGPPRYAESKYIALCMVSNLQVLLIALPLLVMVFDDATPFLFVRCAFIFLNDLAVLVTIFVPKFLMMYVVRDRFAVARFAVEM